MYSPTLTASTQSLAAYQYRAYVQFFIFNKMSASSTVSTSQPIPLIRFMVCSTVSGYIARNRAFISFQSGSQIVLGLILKGVQFLTPDVAISKAYGQTIVWKTEKISINWKGTNLKVKLYVVSRTLSGAMCILVLCPMNSIKTQTRCCASIFSTVATKFANDPFRTSTLSPAFRFLGGKSLPSSSQRNIRLEIRFRGSDL